MNVGVPGVDLGVVLSASCRQRKGRNSSRHKQKMRLQKSSTLCDGPTVVPKTAVGMHTLKRILGKRALLLCDGKLANTT